MMMGDYDGEVVMRHLFAVVMGALMVVSLAGCSEGQDPLDVEFVHPKDAA